MKTVKIARTFVCKNCGNVVTIAEGGRHSNLKLDKRTVFCSDKCRRQFWRKRKSTQEERLQRAQEIADKLGI